MDEIFIDQLEKVMRLRNFRKSMRVIEQQSVGYLWLASKTERAIKISCKERIFLLDGLQKLDAKNKELFINRVFDFLKHNENLSGNEVLESCIEILQVVANCQLLENAANFKMLQFRNNNNVKIRSYFDGIINYMHNKNTGPGIGGDYQENSSVYSIS